MFCDDVYEICEINGFWMRDLDYRVRLIWIYSGYLLNFRNLNFFIFEKNYKYVGDVNKIF